MIAGKVKKTHIFDNTAEGYKRLSAWLNKQGMATVTACMEATGCYGDALATYLYNEGYVVSVVNPAQIKSFSGAQLKNGHWGQSKLKSLRQFILSPAN